MSSVLGTARIAPITHASDEGHPHYCSCSKQQHFHPFLRRGFHRLWPLIPPPAALTAMSFSRSPTPFGSPSLAQGYQEEAGFLLRRWGCARQPSWYPGLPVPRLVKPAAHAAGGGLLGSFVARAGLPLTGQPAKRSV